MNENIWLPSPEGEKVQYRLVRDFPGWRVEGWVGKQCLLEYSYWLKSSARRHIAIAVSYEKSREIKGDN